MSLKSQIMNDIKEAMKAKNTVVLATLRLLNSSIKNKEIEVRPAELTEKDILSVLKKAAKQRQDAMEQYEKANRQDLVDQEASELKVIESYLPAPMTEEQLSQLVGEAIKEVGASSMKEMGAVMKVVQEKTGGAADNKLVSQMVKSQLQ